jgi:hypothetical protein
MVLPSSSMKILTVSHTTVVSFQILSNSSACHTILCYFQHHKITPLSFKGFHMKSEQQALLVQ